jgi:hypothetical protein
MFRTQEASAREKDNSRQCNSNREILIAKSNSLREFKPQCGSLLPLSVPEVHRLLWQLFWQWIPSPTLILDWSYWQRRHQALAKFYHYKRRLKQSFSYLQL